MKNFKSKTILSGLIIDAGSHFWKAGLQALSANLPPALDTKSDDIVSIISLLNLL